MSERPPCRLYLVAEPGLEPEVLEAALAAAPVACLLLPAATAGLGPLIRQAQARDVAALVADDVGAAMAAAADGVHLSTAGPLVAQVRQALGAEAILGVACGGSRHDALMAGEAGADFIALEQALWQDRDTLAALARQLAERR